MRARQIPITTQKKPLFLPKREVPAKVYPESYLKSLSSYDDPDVVHKVCGDNVSSFIRPVPVHKTEEEINRMHEYNAIMGRR